MQTKTQLYSVNHYWNKYSKYQRIYQKILINFSHKELHLCWILIDEEKADIRGQTMMEDHTRLSKKQETQSQKDLSDKKELVWLDHSVLILYDTGVNQTSWE